MTSELPSDRVLYGSTYYGRPDRPVHLVLDDSPGRKLTACGRRLDIGTPTCGPVENVTCRRCRDALERTGS